MYSTLGLGFVLYCTDNDKGPQGTRCLCLADRPVKLHLWPLQITGGGVEDVTCMHVCS